MATNQTKMNPVPEGFVPNKALGQNFLSNRSIIDAILEQAQIDGANRWQIFWHITLPMIRPAILATVFIRLMDALRTVDEVTKPRLTAASLA